MKIANEFIFRKFIKPEPPVGSGYSNFFSVVGQLDLNFFRVQFAFGLDFDSCGYFLVNPIFHKNMQNIFSRGKTYTVKPVKMVPANDGLLC